LRGVKPSPFPDDTPCVFDEDYEIRNGTSVGVGAPQYGPRRSFYAGVTKTF
jgi:hypothetical protein